MLVSVIIPTYNRKDLVIDAIQSVLRQTHKDLEVLVCDDGSNDGTDVLVKSIKDPRVFWISGERSRHPSRPRNKGVAYAKGLWVAFLDSDDIWYPSKLEEQLFIANDKKLEFICSNAEVIRKTGEVDLYFKHRQNELLFLQDLLADNTVITSSVVIKKSLIIKAGGFPISKNIVVGEDYILWLLILLNNKVYYLNKPLCIYRDEPDLSIRGQDKRSELAKYSIVIKYCISYVFRNKFSFPKLLTLYRFWFNRWRLLRDN